MLVHGSEIKAVFVRSIVRRLLGVKFTACRIRSSNSAEDVGAVRSSESSVATRKSTRYYPENQRRQTYTRI